jgi:hypothetical protein
VVREYPHIGHVDDLVGLPPTISPSWSSVAVISLEVKCIVT